jgi:predicted small lipoprotein YifL
MLKNNFHKIYLVFPLVGAVLAVLLMAGCGKKGPPLSPEEGNDPFPTIYPDKE